MRKGGREEQSEGRPLRIESFLYLLILRRFVQEENTEAERGWPGVRNAIAPWLLLSQLLPFRKSYRDPESQYYWFGGGGGERMKLGTENMVV